MERNVRLLLCYDGTDFHGWQVQPGMRTVQSEMEDRLRRVLRHPIALIASGRTDSGVHASGQVANVVTSSNLPCVKIRAALGARLPGDLDIRAVSDVSRSFHATRSAQSKLYRYRILNDHRRPVNTWSQRYCHHFWERLDIDRMRTAASMFVGEHDFTSMATTGCVRQSMVRRVTRCDVNRHLDEVHIDVEGTGFLHNQVRIMVGTLLEIGRGRWEPETVARVLASRDRTLAGPTAPAHGLCLQWVRYPAELLRPESAAN